jgi:hypothetical protein
VNTRWHHIAQVISYTINPLVVPPTLYGIVTYRSGGTLAQVATAVGISIVFFCLIPLVSMVRAIKGKPHATIELRDRTHRTIPYLVTIASYLVALAVIQAVDLPARGFLIAMTLAFAGNGLLLLVINLYWKISLHVSTLAGFFSILWFFMKRYEIVLSPVKAGPAELLALTAVGVTALVMWARVETRAHTPAQVFGGAAFGITAPYVMLVILAQSGLFDTF